MAFEANMDQLFCAAERNHAIRASWPISARPPKGMPERRAPILDDRRFVAAELGIVGQDVADPPKPQPADPPDGRRGRHMKHRAVDPVEMLADILDQQVDAGEVGLERRSEQVRQHRQVERHRRPLEPGSSADGSRLTSQSSARWIAASPPSRSTSCGIGPQATSSPALCNPASRKPASL